MTAGSPELAVVIVDYEAGDWLERCLASIQAHRGGVTVEAVVVDNASTDGSAEAAARVHPWIQVLPNPTNRYLSPAWNQGAAATSAPFVLFLNPDTEWWRGTLEDLVDAARSLPRAGIVGPVIRNSDGTVYPSGRTFPSVLDAIGHAFISPFTRDNPFTRRHEMQGWDRTTERRVDWVSGCCLLVRREALEGVGGFDEGFPLYGEELDIATRLRDAGWEVWFTPVAEVLHEVGVSTGGDRRPHRLVVMHSRSLFRYYRKHRASGWRIVTLPPAWVALRLRAELAWAWGRMRSR